MIDLKPILDFLAPFRDIWLKRFEARPQISLEKRIEYLDQIRSDNSEINPTQAGAIAKELFGNSIRGDLISAIARFEGDRAWMIEKYLDSGGERTFRWDDELKIIRPVPVGMNVPPYSSTESFEDARRSATNTAVVTLVLNVLLIPFGILLFKGYVEKPSSIPGIVIATLALISGSILVISTLGSAIRDETRYKAANAFWTAWFASLTEEQRVLVHNASSPESKRIQPAASLLNLFIAIAMFTTLSCFPLIKLALPYVDNYLSLAPITLLLAITSYSSVRWSRLGKAQESTTPPNWMKFGTLALSFIGFLVTGQQVRDLIKAFDTGFGWSHWVRIIELVLVVVSLFLNCWYWIKAEKGLKHQKGVEVPSAN